MWAQRQRENLFLAVKLQKPETIVGHFLSRLGSILVNVQHNIIGMF